MNSLSFRDRELVALGAALGSNCVACVEYHVAEARKAGLDDGEIRAAIELADKIKQVPANKVLAAATKMLGATTPNDSAACCAPAASKACC